MKMKLRPFLFYLWACLCLLTGCKPSGRTDNKDTQRPVITVSIEPLRYITERIAGDGFRVETFVPKGSSPETYEPTPEQMMQLGQSLVYFTVGDLGLNVLGQTGSGKCPLKSRSSGLRKASSS